ncbi:Uncharacterised protein [Listeria ivanovii subsp. londoniensis]|uniref:Uncharacterized protein n=1 Tax=Listeria ivanovii TaxID=1638 RepID=A0AAX2DQL4_LISIV|nr:hypothetical protein JL58_01795 [Listeria ivanovii subsp. londoniensis]EFR98220.1 hypothetical protein NT05LI_0426 [Listeria ivanovii FSL F6-596]SDW91651.1 hypothetical protein SAMN05421782_10834 [Listeria ivanovii]VEH44751.1 Uncharacterised protein [Listeria ivanovii subsp. londoniensis]
MWGFVLYLLSGLVSSIVSVTILDSKISTIKKIIGGLFFLGLGAILLKNAWESGKIVFGW